MLMRATVEVLLSLLAGSLALVVPSRMSSLDSFRNLSPAEVKSIQFLFEHVSTGHGQRALILAVDPAKADCDLFEPYGIDTIHYDTIHATLVHGRWVPEPPTVIRITEDEARAATESLLTIPLIRKSGVSRGKALRPERPGYHFGGTGNWPILALSIGKTGRDTAVYHCVMGPGIAWSVLTTLGAAWSGNRAALDVVRGMAERIGPPPPIDLSSQVQVRLGKFKVEKSSGMPATRIELRNRGPAIIGRVVLVLQSGDGVQIVSALGTTRRCLPLGSPYVVIQDSGVIESGTTKEITVRILNPNNVSLPIQSARAWLVDGNPAY